MSKKHFLLLLLLSALWGSSFMFMRILSPVFGAAGTAGFRLLVGATTLIIYYAITRYKIQWRRDWFLLVTIGIVNSSIPFFLYAFAALHIPSSLSVMINAMSPMFGAIFAALILGERIAPRTAVGLLLGVLGVAAMTGSKALPKDLVGYASLAACLGAVLCYGLSGAMVRKWGQRLEARALAGGSQLFAGLALMPIFVATGPSEPVLPIHFALIVLFGALCSGLAYLIYYYLMQEVGPTKTLTVTFLMPVFGIIWGSLLLHEAIYTATIVGGVIILAGTYLVTFKPNKVT